MAGSRNKLPEPAGALGCSGLTGLTGLTGFDRCLDAVIAGGSVAPPTVAQPWLIGFSGGPDSLALLQLLVNRFEPTALMAVHVDHQIHADAARWSAQCADLAGQMGIRFESVRVGPPGASPAGGLENWARNARREAFVQVAGSIGATVLVLAHHANDQIETVLHHLLRGAGLEGLAGMQTVSERDGLTLLRPLLNVSRDDLQAVVHQFALTPIHDPSNDDQSFTRNRLRHDSLPAIEKVLPGFSAGLLSGAAHLGQVSRVLPQLLFEHGVPVVLSRQQLRDAGEDVAPLMLRVWLRECGVRSPDSRRLRDMLTQLTQSDSAHPSFVHDGFQIYAYRDQIKCDPCEPVHSGQPMTIVWRGEPAIDLPGWQGAITFTKPAQGTADAQGVFADLIRDRIIQVTPLRMSAGLRERSAGPTRRLRQLCQERAIAPDRRQRLPMLSIDSDVLFAAGIGLNAQWLNRTARGERVVIGWQAL